LDGNQQSLLTLNSAYPNYLFRHRTQKHEQHKGYSKTLGVQENTNYLII